VAFKTAVISRLVKMSEGQLQGQLNGARATDLIKRIESSTTRGLIEAPTEHHVRFAEGGANCDWIPKVPHGLSKIWMIEYVEHLRSELQF